MTGLKVFILFLSLLSRIARTFTAKCHSNNTISVHVPFARPAEILELNYGFCTKSSSGVDGITQNPSDLSFDIKLDIKACGMDGTLRTLDYTQVLSMRIGRNGTDMLTGEHVQMTYEHYEIDSYCSIQESYEVLFNYHNLTQFKDSANLNGTVTKSFMIKAYDDTFDTSDFPHSTVAGNYIYLGLTLADDQAFDFEHSEFALSTCTVEETVNSASYTLFDAMIPGGCVNDAVDFSMTYDASKNMWQFSHILFLLGDVDESSFFLRCTVEICAVGVDSTCDTVKSQCAVTNITSEEITPETFCGSSSCNEDSCSGACTFATGYYMRADDCRQYCYCAGDDAFDHLGNRVPSRFEQCNTGLIWDPYCKSIGVNLPSTTQLPSPFDWGTTGGCCKRPENVDSNSCDNNE